MTEPRKDRWFLLVLLCLPTMSLLMSTNSVITALATIGKTFPDAHHIAEWTLLSYSITAASLSIPAGNLGDRYGLRRIYIIGLVVFLIGALGASLASSAELLILSRIVSGMGSAILAPVALAFLNRLFTGSEKPVAFGYWAASVTIGIVVGPLVGGWVQTVASWHLIFPATALPAALALIMLHRLPAFSSDGGSPPMDIKGVAGLAILPFLTLFTIAEAGGLSLASIVALLASILILGSWTWRHLQTCPHPAVPISRLKHSSWWRPSVLQLIIRCTFLSMLTLLTTYFHSVEGKSEYLSSQALLPFCLAVGLASLSSGFICRALGARRVLISVFILAFMALLSLLTLTTTGFRPQDWVAVIAIGFLVGNTAQLSRLAISNFPPDESMRGAALNTLIINLGISLGAALPSLVRSILFDDMGLGDVIPADQLVNLMHADIIVLILMCAVGGWQALRLADQAQSSPG